MECKLSFINVSYQELTGDSLPAIRRIYEAGGLASSEAAVKAMRHWEEANPPGKLYFFGFRGTVARNTLANTNAVRDWRICADFTQSVICMARKLYADDSYDVDLSDNA